jgi:hypothetical protein
MNSGSTLSVIISIGNMALRTQSGYFHLGIRRIFNCWNSVYAPNLGSKRRSFRTSLQGAPNINNRSILVGSVAAGRKYQLQACKSVVHYVQKECRILYSSSTSALEEEKTHPLTGPLTKLQAHDLIMRLTGEERTALLTALQEFQSEKRKAEYEGNNLLCKRSESHLSLPIFLFFLFFFFLSTKRGSGRGHIPEDLNLNLQCHETSNPANRKF